FSSRRRHTRCLSDWSSDVCSSDLKLGQFQTRGCSETGFTYAAFSAEQQNPHTNIVLQTRIQLLGYSGVARSEFARQEWPPRTQRSEERRVGKERRTMRAGPN